MGGKASSEVKPPQRQRPARVVKDPVKPKGRLGKPEASNSAPPKPQQPPPPKKKRQEHAGGGGEDELPPEIQEIIKQQEEEAKMHEDVAMAIAAAHALCDVELDDDEGDDDVDGNNLDAPELIRGRGGDKKALPDKGDNGVEEYDDDDDEVSLHSSDYRDEELMREVADLEAACASEQQQRVDELEMLIAQHKKRALALMKEGDKPAALAELRTAKEYEKELASLKAE